LYAFLTISPAPLLTQPQVDNDFGSKNNKLTVNASDFEVFEALAMDSNSSGGTSSTRSGNNY